MIHKRTGEVTDRHRKIARIEKALDKYTPFKVELSFTLYDWIVMDNLINAKESEIDL